MNQWENETVVIVASGPSLTRKQVDYCKGKARVLVVNDNYKLAPWADALYAADPEWWEHHGPSLDGFAGQKWTQKPPNTKAFNSTDHVIEAFNLLYAHGRQGDGFSKDPSIVHYGGNSGFQAINLALHFGVSRVLLLGFDMKMGKKRHWFGDHPGRLNKASNYNRWLPHFADAAKQTDKIINCTPDSALTCFPMMDLKDAL